MLCSQVSRPGWGHHRHTHTAAGTIPQTEHLRLRHLAGLGCRGWGEKRRHLYWVLAASGLLKVGLKTPEHMDGSCTLLHSAAFYKQPKNFNILPALFFVSLSLPSGRGHGQLEVAILTPAFFPPSSSPRSPTATLSLLRKSSCLQILGPEKSPGTGLLPNKAESYMWAIKRHLFI